jgi:hypothetical protein
MFSPVKNSAFSSGKHQREPGGLTLYVLFILPAEQKEIHNRKQLESKAQENTVLDCEIFDVHTISLICSVCAGVQATQQQNFLHPDHQVMT